MGLDALNWSIGWIRCVRATCPHQPPSTSQGMKLRQAALGLRASARIVLATIFQILKMIAVTLVIKHLPKPACRNSKLFAENSEHRALTVLQVQGRQPASCRRFPECQGKTEHSVQGKHGKHCSGPYS